MPLPLAANKLYLKFVTRIFLIFITILASNCYAQEVLTIRKVFDFEINDEFHYEILRRFTSYPEGERILVTDKYFSEDSNMITYEFSRDGYNSWYEDKPEPHIEYSFWKDKKIVSYTALDSSIFYLQPELRYDTIAKYYEVFSYDSTNYFSSNLCNTLINGIFITESDFEPIQILFEYGKGIGLTEEWVVDITSGSEGKEGKKLIYYYKTIKSCGTPDLTSVDLKKSEQFILFPNPVYERLNLYINDIYQGEAEIQILDIKGIILQTLKTNNNRIILDLSNYVSGIYFIRVLSGNNSSYKKVFKY